MEIKPVDKTVKQLLESGFYQIPRFQRPYSWDQENVDDFWIDAVANSDPDYFIGSFVLYTKPNAEGTYFVVDGQQRLTTITLLLAAARNALDKLGYKNQALGLQKLIEKEDLDNQTQYILQTETSYPFLQDYIQKYGKPELTAEHSDEQESLKLAFKYIESKIQSTLLAIINDPAVAALKKKEHQKNALLQIRDRVLRLQLITIFLTKEDDAYLIFETLNTRGKDLGISDLVKNHLTRLLKPKNKGVDQAREKWKLILKEFNTSAAEIDINAFLHHDWLSRNAYLSKERLFKAIKDSVNAASAGTYLDSLVVDSRLYRAAFEPYSRLWKPEERVVAESLRALNVFRVVQPVPLLLSLLRAYDEGKVALSQLRTILRDMENFHVQFTAITAQRTGGGTAKMYAATAEQLSKAKNKDACAVILKDFRAKMRDRVPEKGEFVSNFRSIEYVSTSTKQKSLVQYLLRRFDEHFRSTSAPVDYGQMSIEHIYPESPSSGATGGYVGLLGNLILLPKALNSNLGNKDFKTKKTAFLKAGVPLDSHLSGARTWAQKEIEERTQALAELAFDTVFKF
jgi:Protein of unknown function DUF262/Protein of unknown function (DUF1524)